MPSGLTPERRRGAYFACARLLAAGAHTWPECIDTGRVHEPTRYGLECAASRPGGLIPADHAQLWKAADLVRVATRVDRDAFASRCPRACGSCGAREGEGCDRPLTRPTSCARLPRPDERI